MGQDNGGDNTGGTMSIIFGFGSTEEKVRTKVKEAILGMSTDEEIDDFIKRWNEDADKFDKMPKDTAPERYTRLFFYDEKIHFHHINRRHPFSPDGCALLVIREPLIREFPKATAGITQEEP